MPAVNRRLHSPRWALWVFAAALLLKSAMPFLATASAQWQGKTLVEVCTVYGVSLAPLAAEPHAPGDPSDPAAGHADEHCALAALAALAPAGTVPAGGVPRAANAADPPRLRTPVLLADAGADWMALLHHGPPELA
jgi:hypothetical protein